MSKKTKISRRDFIRTTGIAAAGGILAGCASNLAQPAAEEAASAATEVPAVITPRKVRIAVGGWAEQNMKDLLAETDFTKQTGIEVEIVLRTDTKETELARLTSPAGVRPAPSEMDVVVSKNNHTRLQHPIKARR